MGAITHVRVDPARIIDNCCASPVPASPEKGAVTVKHETVLFVTGIKRDLGARQTARRCVQIARKIDRLRIVSRVNGHEFSDLRKLT